MYLVKLHPPGYVMSHKKPPVCSMFARRQLGLNIIEIFQQTAPTRTRLDPKVLYKLRIYERRPSWLVKRDGIEVKSTRFTRKFLNFQLCDFVSTMCLLPAVAETYWTASFGTALTGCWFTLNSFGAWTDHEKALQSVNTCLKPLIWCSHTHNWHNVNNCEHVFQIVATKQDTWEK